MKKSILILISIAFSCHNAFTMDQNLIELPDEVALIIRNSGAFSELEPEMIEINVPVVRFMIEKIYRDINNNWENISDSYLNTISKALEKKFEKDPEIPGYIRKKVAHLFLK